MLALGAAASAQTQKPQKKLTVSPDMPAEIYNKLAPVTVKILAAQGAKNGSGAIVGLTPKGHALILTACHVIAKNFEETDPDVALEFHKDLQLRIAGEVKLIRAHVVPDFVDKTNDLALLATNEPIAADRAISYTRTEKVTPGEQVAAFGFPRGEKLSQTVGRIVRLESKGALT
jgi:S1-C subfamily serine protease